MASHWTVGDIEITRIDASNFVLPTADPMPGWAVPGFTPSIDETPLAFSALVIRAPDITIVADPWIVDDSARSQPGADDRVDALLAEMQAIGVAAGEVDLVVNTHIDGIGWNTRPGDDAWRPTFPHARYVFPAAELAAVDRGEPINGSEHLGPLEVADVIDRVDPPHELAPGISVVDAPGHNFGHLAVRVERDGELAIYAGHLVLSLLQVDDPARDLGDSDHAVATASRRDILGELAERRGVLLTTLIGGPGGGVVHAHASGFALVAAD